jgi:hypothetical protein
MPARSGMATKSRLTSSTGRTGMRTKIVNGVTLASSLIGALLPTALVLEKGIVIGCLVFLCVRASSLVMGAYKGQHGRSHTRLGELNISVWSPREYTDGRHTRVKSIRAARLAGRKRLDLIVTCSVPCPDGDGLRVGEYESGSR